MFWILPYLLYLLIFGIFWLCLKSYKITDNLNSKAKISVIIPFKNEENNLPKLIASILNQKSSLTNIQFIFINDNSKDASFEIVRKNLSKTNLNFLLLDNPYIGKKKAIDYAIKFAENQWILTLDADVLLPRNYFESLSIFLGETEAVMSLLPVIYKITPNDKIFNKMQALEFLSLQATTAATASCDLPTMANGANMVFKKDEYLKIKNPLKFEIKSGDDIFLLHNLKKKGKITFLSSADVAVETYPASNLKQFVNQRLRWAGKTKFYNDFFTKFLAFMVFTINFLLIVLIFVNVKIALLAFLIKSIIDFFFLRTFSKILNQQFLMKYFPITELLYPFYVVFIAIYSLFTKPRWK